MKPRIGDRVVECLLQIVHRRQDSGVEDAGKIRSLIHSARDDVVVSQRSSFFWRVPMLLPDDVQNRLLDVQQNVLDAGHVLEVIHALPLHLDDLIVARPVVE